MTETFPTIQWNDEDVKKPNQGTVTRAFLSNEIVRWRERPTKKALGLISESAGISAMGSLPQSAIRPPQTEVRIPRAKKAATAPAWNYSLLKKYEGFVTSRCEGSFTARLFENTRDYPVVEAEFDLEELSEADRELVVEGAALVWTIGYNDEGSRKRESLIYIRRRPPFDDDEIESGRQSVEELTRDIQWK